MEELALGEEKRKKSLHVRVRERRKRQIFIDVFPGQFPSAQFGLNLKCPWTVPLQTAKPVTTGTESTGSRRRLWEESWGPRQPRGPLPSPALGRLAHVLRWDADICLPPSPCSFPLAPPHGSNTGQKTPSNTITARCLHWTPHRNTGRSFLRSIRTVQALLPYLSHPHTDYHHFLESCGTNLLDQEICLLGLSYRFLGLLSIWQTVPMWVNKYLPLCLKRNFQGRSPILRSRSNWGRQPRLRSSFILHNSDFW